MKKAKVFLIGGQAKPGPVLASLGINMMQFAKDFNEKTKDKNGEIIPVLFTIHPDKRFTFVIKTTPTSILLKKELNIEKASANAKTTIVGTISIEKIKSIAQYKLCDSNAYDINAMIKMVEGTAKQMGIKIEK